MKNGIEKRKSFRDLSRQRWVPNEGNKKSIDTIKIGALLRIADASEKMAANFLQMQDRIKELEQEVEYWKKANYRKFDEIDQMHRSNAALHGHITRLKNKMAKDEEGNK